MRLKQYPSAIAGRPLRQRSGSWRPALRRALIAAGVLVAVVLIALGVGVALILSGPTEFGIVRSRIETALQTRLGDDYGVSVGKAVIDVDPVLGLVVEVDDIEVRDTNQSVVARAPATRFAIDPLALLTFRLSVSTVEFSDVELSLVRARTGEVYLGNPDTDRDARAKAPKATAVVASEGDGGFPDLFTAVRIAERGLGPSLEAAIKAGFLRFQFVGGTIDIWDAGSSERRRFVGTDINVTVDPLSGSLAANLVTSGYSGRWTADFERTVDPRSGDRQMSVLFSQLSLADLFPRIAERGSLFAADVPLYGRASVAYGADGAIRDASLRLDLGAGVFRFGETRETIQLDEATLKLRWDVQNRVVLVEPSPFFLGETRGVVTGTIRPLGEPADRRYAFELATRGAVLAARDATAPPLVATIISISGVADVPGKLVTIGDFTAETPTGSISAAGSLGFEGKTPSLAIAASATPMPAATLKQLWPPFIAGAARRWVMQHVIDGRVVSGKYEAAIPSGILWNRERPPMPDGAMRLDVRLEDVAFTTFGELPPVVNASGNVVLAGKTLGIDLESGEVRTPSGANVAVNAGAFAVDNVFNRSTEGVIEVQLSGSAKALGEIADAKPFLTLARRDVTPADLSGTADASVSLRLPLRAGITESDVDWKVSIAGTDLGSKAPIEGRTFSDANVTITVTPDEVAVRGKAKIDGVAADVSLSQPITLGGKEAGPGQQVARLLLDQAARKRLGIGLDDILGGTVSALISNISDGGPGQHYDLDLKQARLVIPGVGWSKGIGVPATLSFDLRPTGDGYLVDDLIFDGDGFGFGGTAKLDKNHGLVSADITRFALKPGDSLSFKLTATKTGYAIVAKGTSFDVRGVIANVKGADTGGSGSGSADISVDATVQKLTGFNKSTMAGAKIAFASAGGRTRKIAVAGEIDGAPVSIDFSDTAAGASLSATAADAGAVLRFVDIYGRIEGGTLAISGKRPGASGPLTGTFDMTNFDIVNEPAMERVVSTASSGPDGGRNGVDPQRLHFARLFAKFRMTDQAINIDEALLRGAVVGATFNGRFDLARSAVTINGTYIPAYAFNNAFSRVPLIGLVLTGGFKEGIIGVTFKVDGPMASPRFFFNPLSAVAPGIFRKVFEFR